MERAHGCFREPLSVGDIEEIEAGMDMLVRHLFARHPEALEEAREAPLTEKIKAHIEIAESAATDLDLKDLSSVDEVAPAMRNLLDAINALN